MADSSSVSSPCVSICALDEEDICIGCFRNIREIGEWYQLTDDEKREVNRRANRRAREKGHLLTGN